MLEYSIKPRSGRSGVHKFRIPAIRSLQYQLKHPRLGPIVLEMGECKALLCLSAVTPWHMTWSEERQQGEVGLYTVPGDESEYWRTRYWNRVEVLENPSGTSVQDIETRMALTYRQLKVRIASRERLSEVH